MMYKIYFGLLFASFMKLLANCNDNNIPNVNSDVGSEKGRVYADLAPILRGREAAYDRLWAHVS